MYACLRTLHQFNVCLKYQWPWCPAYWPRCPLIIFKSQGQLALPSNCPNSRPVLLHNVKPVLLHNVKGSRDDNKLLFCLSCLSVLSVCLVCLSVSMSMIASKREVSTQIGSSLADRVAPCLPAVLVCCSCVMLVNVRYYYQDLHLVC